MEAFILETLTATGWRRGGDTYWTLDSAITEGQRQIRRKLARGIRVLPVAVGDQAVAELSASAKFVRQLTGEPEPPLVESVQAEFVARLRGDD